MKTKVRIRDRADFRLRVLVRLAWIGLTQKAFCEAVGYQTASFSRILRSDNPREQTMERVARGLGLTPEQLMGDVELLLCEHPAIEGHMGVSDRVSSIRLWLETQS